MLTMKKEKEKETVKERMRELVTVEKSDTVERMMMMTVERKEEMKEKEMKKEMMEEKETKKHTLKLIPR